MADDEKRLEAVDVVLALLLGENLLGMGGVQREGANKLTGPKGFGSFLCLKMPAHFCYFSGK